MRAEPGLPVRTVAAEKGCPSRARPSLSHALFWKGRSAN